MKSIKKPWVNKKLLTMFALILALGTAVYLNYRFADGLPHISTSAPGAQERDEQEHYGDPLFVSSNLSDINEYFSSARLARSQSRDEALAALQRALSDTELSELEKSELTGKLTSEARAISTEAVIENLMKAKGFYDCIAHLAGDTAKIVVAVSEEGLTQAQAAQIMEIVATQANIDASKISIVEVK